MYKYVDYLEEYGRIMQFNKNKLEPIHRWYPFVEGYSKEFIQSIVDEQNTSVKVCLEPFSGSGTTALELQNLGIKCISFEVNPFMYLLARVKLINNYDPLKLERHFKSIKYSRVRYKKIELSNEFDTLYENGKVKKWNYHKSVGIAIEKLKLSISKITDEDYKSLFIIVLASILLDVSNLYRNGKCLSYKKGWKNRIILEQDVFDRFDNRFLDCFLADVKNYLSAETNIYNSEFLYNYDSRVGIEKFVEDSTVDLVITSPPYLNSRDYTDTYMLELKTLGFTATLGKIKELRKKTLRSHVQINWDDSTDISNMKLQLLLKELEMSASKTKAWNNSIIDMVRLYFVDIEIIFKALYKKLKVGGRIYFNISNSAYYNILVDTIEICTSIAETIGFEIIEIRKARYLKTSPQQQDKISKLLEAVIVLEK